MSYLFEEQCEDGELQQSPSEESRYENNLSSSGEIENCYGLEIRPPQSKYDETYIKNKRIKSFERTSRRDDERHKSRHSDKYVQKRTTKTRDREIYHKDRHKFNEVNLPDKDGQRSNHRKRSDKEINKIIHEQRYEERADKALRDLRERLLSKRCSTSNENRKRHQTYKENHSAHEQSELYIKEIIEISSDRKHGSINKYSKESPQSDKLSPSALRSKRRKSSPPYKRDIKIISMQESVVSVSNSSDDEESYKNSARRKRSNSYSSETTEISSPCFEKSNSLSNRNRSRSRSNSCDKMEGDNDRHDNESSETPDMELPPYFPAIQGCRSVEEFQCLNRIEEGTYGVVYRAKDKRSEEIVALKRLKMEKEKEGFPITSLREINTLLKGQHPNIVTVREIVVGSNMDKIFIVMDYVEHDLKSLMETMRHKKQNFLPGEIKCLLKQLLLAVGHLHDNWILHRDLKTSNLLLSHKGILKVGDFGLAREYGSPLKAYTPIVVTLWYRAPELLLCTKEYSTPIDMWSVGCIFAELLLMNALFPGKSEVDQLNRVFKDLGTPSEKIWPGFNQLPAVKKIKLNEYPTSDLKSKFNALTDIGLELLLKFLTYDPSQRITAEEALSHPYFDEQPLPIDPSMFPTWPAKSELGQKRAMAASPKPPSGGGEYKKLKGDDENFGFRLTTNRDVNNTGTSFNLKF